MRTEMFVKPAPGLLVRHPNTKKLDPDGETVPRNAYWNRRLKDGDVVKAKPLKKAAATAPAKSAATTTKGDSK